MHNHNLFMIPAGIKQWDLSLKGAYTRTIRIDFVSAVHVVCEIQRNANKEDTGIWNLKRIRLHGAYRGRGGTQVRQVRKKYTGTA